MTKVHILTTCSDCGGAAYVPTGGPQVRYVPCTACEGSGNQEHWVSLREFAVMLDAANTLEPDYLELAQSQPISQYQDSCEAAGI